MNFLISVAFVILIGVVLNAQVNIEQYRSSYDGNIDQSTFGFNANVQRSVSNLYKFGVHFIRPFSVTDSLEAFLISKIDDSKQDGDDVLDYKFFHIRVMDTSSDQLIVPEAYLQLENNNLSLLKYRYLIGGGFRYSWMGMIVGTSVLHEWFQEYASHSRSIWRLSQYVSKALVSHSLNSITCIVYIQPSLMKLQHIRFYGELVMRSSWTDDIATYAKFKTNYFSHSSVFRGVTLFFDSGIEFNL